MPEVDRSDHKNPKMFLKFEIGERSKGECLCVKASIEQLNAARIDVIDRPQFLGCVPSVTQHIR